MSGQWIDCGACHHGVVAVYSGRDFEGPGECPYCTAGVIWRYPSGALAKYPGGPFIGREPAAVSPEAPHA